MVGICLRYMHVAYAYYIKNSAAVDSFGQDFVLHCHASSGMPSGGTIDTFVVSELMHLLGFLSTD